MNGGRPFSTCRPAARYILRKLRMTPSSERESTTPRSVVTQQSVIITRSARDLCAAFTEHTRSWEGHHRPLQRTHRFRRNRSLADHIVDLLRDRSDIVLHLGEVVFIDSNGLGMLVRLMTSTRSARGDSSCVRFQSPSTKF